MERWATFDCYGTLIDWDGGVRACLAELWPLADADTLLARYHEVEPKLQEGRGVSYRQILEEALAEVAKLEGLELANPTALSGSLPSWAPFPDTAPALEELRARGWKLAILSNTDADLLGTSLSAIGVPVDHRIVASAIGSYKPAFGHWEAFFKEAGADRRRHVHVAASLFHDVEPCAALGLPCVWIDRLGQASDVPRAGTLLDLSGLPDLLDTLVPGA